MIDLIENRLSYFVHWFEEKIEDGKKESVVK